MDVLRIVAIVIGGNLMALGFRALCRGLWYLIPAGRVREALYKERGYTARPTLQSLRHGLK